MAAVGVLTNTVAAYLVAEVDVNVLLGISAVVTAVSPVLMAVASLEWTYWAAAFIAMTLSPINGDGECFIFVFLLPCQSCLVFSCLPRRQLQN